MAAGRWPLGPQCFGDMTPHRLASVHKAADSLLCFAVAALDFPFLFENDVYLVQTSILNSDRDLYSLL